MASIDWYEVYQYRTTDWLIAKLAELDKRDTGLSSLTSASGKSATAELATLAAQTAALTRVLTERSGAGQSRVGVADFSRMADFSRGGGCGMASQVLAQPQQTFARIIGDGVALSFVVEHGLNSVALIPVVQENKPNGRLLGPSEYAILFNTVNSLTIYFSAAPTAGQYLLTLNVAGSC